MVIPQCGRLTTKVTRWRSKAGKFLSVTVDKSLVPYRQCSACRDFRCRCCWCGAVWIRQFALSRYRCGRMGIGCRLRGVETAVPRQNLCLAKTPSGQKLNRSIDILTVKSYLDRPTRARWKAMKIQADGILARDTSGLKQRIHSRCMLRSLCKWKLEGCHVGRASCR